MGQEKKMNHAPKACSVSLKQETADGYWQTDGVEQKIIQAITTNINNTSTRNTHINNTHIYDMCK